MSCGHVPLGSKARPESFQAGQGDCWDCYRFLRGKVNGSKVSLQTLPCKFYGEPLSGLEREARGLGHTKLWTWCDNPTLPLGEVVCACQGCGPQCPGYTVGGKESEKDTKYGPVGRRHLVYHVLPVAGNGVWQAGVDRLKARWDLFTGRKVISIMTGDTVKAQSKHKEELRLDRPEVVKAQLPADCEVIELPNDPSRWELVSWSQLWYSILGGAKDEDAVLYAHAKGVTRPEKSTPHRWADLLYTLALDYWPEVEKLLRQFPVVGPLKKSGVFAGVLGKVPFHYSGNFWWVRVGDMRNRVATKPPLDPWGTEAWPGKAFRLAEGGNLWSPVGVFDLYQPPEMDRVEREFRAWQKTHPPSIPVPVMVTPTSQVRLSVVVCTAGRSTLNRALASITPQLRHGDELLIQRDETGDWGATPRTRGMLQATGTHVLFADDDDRMTPDALERVREAVESTPHRPHVFRMRRLNGHRDWIPHGRRVRVGDISTQCVCVPNDKDKLGTWGTRYEGDYDFIESTLKFYPAGPVFHEDVVSVWRPWDVPAKPPRWWSWEPDGFDKDAWEETVILDEYRLKELDLDGKVVLDLGAHVGTVSYVVHRLGAAVVHAYEPAPASLKHLHRNVRKMPEVKVFAEAVGEPGRRWEHPGRPLGDPPVISLDQAIERVGSKVDLLKIDIEDAEYVALGECTLLPRVDRIHGEWHTHFGQTGKDLANLLASHGFTVEVSLCTRLEGCGMFFASR